MLDYSNPKIEEYLNLIWKIRDTPSRITEDRCVEKFYRRLKEEENLIDKEGLIELLEITIQRKRGLDGQYHFTETGRKVVPVRRGDF